MESFTHYSTNFGVATERERNDGIHPMQSVMRRRRAVDLSGSHCGDVFKNATVFRPSSLPAWGGAAGRDSRNLAHVRRAFV